MTYPGLIELGPCKAVEAAQRLLAVERRFGLAREVEGGLFRLRLFGGDGPPPSMTREFGDWVEAQVGAPPLLNPKNYREKIYRQTTFEGVRGLLLPEERFGVRSPDDTAWFDATPEGAAGIEERDAALRDLLAALEPALLCCMVDVRRLELERAPMGVFVVAGKGSGIVCLGATVSFSVQLDTRAYGTLFQDGAP